MTSQASAASASPPEIIVRFRRLPGTELDVVQAARDVVQTTLCCLQRRLDAPEVLLPAAGRSEGWQTTQSAEPIGYKEASERLVFIQADFGDAPANAVTDRGRILKLNPRTAGRFRRRLDGVVDPSIPLAKRRPMTVNIRPGVGGAQRAVNTKPGSAGLEEFGSPTWWQVSGGAMLGIIEVDPLGDTVVMARLSGDDRDDTLADQLRKAFALAAAFPDELRIRCVLLADDMSGTREVRPPRGLPPASGSGIYEREDILLLEHWADEGWVKNVIWRDERRIARDVLPAELILNSLMTKRIHLWLASYGRQLHWVRDRVLMRILEVISAEDRDHTVQKLYDGRLDKGPGAGNGWLNTPPPFGFFRNPKTHLLEEDAEQLSWIHRACELAELGTPDKKGGLSIRKLRKLLAEEGCTFSVDRLRKIITSRLYVTGEYTVKVKGIEVAQTPLKLSNPVPMERHLRILELMQLRQGGDVNTPIGEFLFNYHESLHKQCMETVTTKGSPTQIRGYVRKRNPEARILRHDPKVPECCQGNGRGWLGANSWQREIVEGPAVTAVRQVATHPEVLKQAMLAADRERSYSPGSMRLSDLERAELERRIQRVREQQNALADQWLKEHPGETDFSAYYRLDDSLTRQIEGMTRRLAADDAYARQPIEAGELWYGSPRTDVEELKRAFLEILSVDTPVDPFMKLLRARLWQTIVHRVIIDDSGSGPITLTIEGHLVPDVGPTHLRNPLIASRELLESYVDRQSGQKTKAERELEELEAEQAKYDAKQLPERLEADDEAEEAQTDLLYAYNKSVLTLIREGADPRIAIRISQLRSEELGATSWIGHRVDPEGGICSWKAVVSVQAAGGLHRWPAGANSPASANSPA